MGLHPLKLPSLSISAFSGQLVGGTDGVKWPVAPTALGLLSHSLAVSRDVLYEAMLEDRTLCKSSDNGTDRKDKEGQGRTSPHLEWGSIALEPIAGPSGWKEPCITSL